MSADTTHASICRACVNLCGVQVETDGDEIVRISGRREDPIYGGYTCAKGRDHFKAYRHPDRLLRSQKRNCDGKHHDIPTQQALDEIAERLAGIVERHGPRAVAMYTGTWWFMDHPANLAVGEAFMKALGSPMLFTPTTIDQAGRFVAKGLHGVWMAPGPCQPDVMLLVGNNPMVSHQGFAGSPGAFYRDFRKAGRELIVLDPRRTETASRATIHLQLRPGSDPAVLGAMIRVILAEGLGDEGFLRENVDGVEALRVAVDALTPDVVAERAGVSSADLVAAARLFAATRNGCVFGGTGANMNGRATLTEYLMLCLDTVCGHWLRAGDPVINALSILPAAAQPAKAQALGPFPSYGYGEQMRVRGLGQTLAGMPTAALAEEILLPGEGQVRALISLGGNPVNAWPDQLRTIEALDSLELFVQSDITMSASAKVADYVLPTSMFYELPGTSILSELFSLISYGPEASYAAYTPAIVPRPPGSDLIDHWRIAFGLAQRLGLELSVFAGAGELTAGGAPTVLDMSREPTDEELIDIVHAGSRISLDNVRATRVGTLYPEPAVVVEAKDPEWPGRLHVGSPVMMSELAAAMQPEVHDEAFPFRMTSRRMPHVFNTPSLATLRHRVPFNPAYMHPDDVRALGLDSGDRVTVRSERAAIEAIVQADDTLRPGLVSMAHNWGGLPDAGADVAEVGANSGRLIANDVAFDPFSGQPRMSGVPVDVRPAPQQDA